jgi:hypothetical protein
MKTHGNSWDWNANIAVNFGSALRALGIEILFSAVGL